LGQKLEETLKALLSLCLGLQYGLEALSNLKNAKFWLTLIIIDKNF
jgi:hypothetical protein